MSTTNMTDIVADDDIDTEALQAKINMSMSFAEDLVSSWIKAEHRANLSKSTVDAQKLLDEQLRRPPRLGVGAPIPESSVAARGAARLKYRLGKGKKSAPEDEGSHKPGYQSEEEEEKRGTARKKMKLDPFTTRSKAKAKLDVNSVTQLFHDPSAPHLQGEDGYSKTGGGDREQGHNILSFNASMMDEVCSSTKKKRRKHSGNEASMISEGQRNPQSLPQTLQGVPCQDQSGDNQANSISPLPSVASSVSFSIPGPFSPVLQPDIQRHREWNVPDISPQSPAPPPPPVPPRSAEDLYLNLPLLNLGGPPARRDGSGKDDNPDGFKKKHRRRKKRKHPIKVDG